MDKGIFSDMFASGDIGETEAKKYMQDKYLKYFQSCRVLSVLFHKTYQTVSIDRFGCVPVCF